MLFYLFALSIIISGVMVISALNPVHSVLWLVVGFIGASAIFILLEVDFIALILVIVYVGAIAILFLFVIMMLNLIGGTDRSNYLPTGFIIGIVFLSEVLILQTRISTVESHVNSNWNFMETSNIEVLGSVLYTNYWYLFILASLILLVALIGAIGINN